LVAQMLNIYFYDAGTKHAVHHGNAASQSIRTTLKDLSKTFGGLWFAGVETKELITVLPEHIYYSGKAAPARMPKALTE
jgi:hypothetical protein